ncbi:MAG: sigma 54-interacting transcriptional regulator [Deltaproteobacteria bacterium]
MKLLLTLDDVSVRVFDLEPGTHHLGSGPRADCVLDPRTSPDLLCRLEVDGGTIVVTETGEADVRGDDGKGFRVTLRSGRWATAGAYRLTAIDSPRPPPLIPGERPPNLALTAESDGVTPPPRESLVFVQRLDRASRRVPVTAGLVIGRDPRCGLPVAHPAVSAEHALVEERPDGFYLRHVGRHALRVNGIELARDHAVRIESGSVIQLTLNPFVSRIDVWSERDLYAMAPDDDVGGAIVGDSEPTRKLRAEIIRLAPLKISVLICGESGTGKELVARALSHGYNPRKPLVIGDCTTLVPTMLERDLFGNEEGAYTDGGKAHVGLVEVADGGSLFLDEIGDITLELQPKLLRLLQEKTFRRMGGTKYHRSDFRALFATWKDLSEEVKAGRMRPDLYYRMMGAELKIAPLRERRADIAPIAERYLGRRDARRMPQLSEEAMRVLEDFPWPGNVRQLERVLELCAIDTDGPEIEPATARRVLEKQGATPAPARIPWDIDDVPARLSEIEREMMAEGLRRAGGKWKRAARELKYRSHTTFYRRAKAYGLLPSKEAGDRTAEEEGDQPFDPAAPPKDDLEAP